MGRPLLLDLFCGAGGCAVGYHRAGFDVVGVDIKPQPSFPFPFIRSGAVQAMQALLRSGGIEDDRGRVWMLSDFDAIHASPPCQAFTVGRHIHQSGHRHPDLVDPTRTVLNASGRPWVMENVMGAPLSEFSAVYCGLMFGLKVLRHRQFEASFLLMSPPHPAHPKGLTTGTLTTKRGGRGNGYSTGEHGLVCVAGNNFVREAGARAMGIDWMSRKELAQAIPPAYTQHVGRQLIDVLAT